MSKNKQKKKNSKRKNKRANRERSKALKRINKEVVKKTATSKPIKKKKIRNIRIAINIPLEAFKGLIGNLLKRGDLSSKTKLELKEIKKKDEKNLYGIKVVAKE